MTNQVIQETVGDLFVRRMDDLEISTVAAAEALSFSTTNVISMIRSGRMRLPINRAILASKLLKVDPVYMLRLLAAEMKEGSDDDRLLEVVSIATGQEPLTEGEWEMVKLYRKYTHNRDILLSKDFEQEFGLIEMALEEVQGKVASNIAGYAERKRRIRRGPKPGFIRKRRTVNLTGDEESQDESVQARPLLSDVDREAEELRELAALKNKNAS